MREGLRLRQRPLPALEGLRQRRFQFPGDDLTTVNRTFAEAVLWPEALEQIVELRVDSARNVGLRITTGTTGAVRIGYDGAPQVLSLDRTAVMAAVFSDGFAARHDAPLQLEDATVRAHIFIDSSSMEVFAGGGTVVMTDLIFPDSDEGGVEVYAIDGDIAHIDLTIGPLRSIRSQRQIIPRRDQESTG